MANGGRADDECAVSHRSFERSELLCFRQERGGAYGGHRFAEGFFVRIDEAQIEDTKIAHRACGGTDVERIARADEYDAEVFEVGRIRQSAIILRCGEKELPHSHRDTEF